MYLAAFGSSFADEMLSSFHLAGMLANVLASLSAAICFQSTIVETC
jgi:hypothetical protein